ncbi:sigma-70 family RNA polymerase sigma factor [Salinibacterium sp. NG253]|uniref:RNA polymerase sigma factor n=1 Tax=Salinibacterium sp. NG253 TaxID=2792039 RepID=UPI0018CE7ACA|nr:sigma-70 family RNA polymerase sigma factor [Salinibacterium sp. NG253]MBH0117032.1 sigma-70 family RNA polymerase sigma factor [Salinibacterium sp. NG253]
MHAVDTRARDAIRRHQSALLAYFTYRVDNVEDAADLFSETALVAWRRRRTMPAPDEEAKRWLYGVARNTLLNHRRTLRRRSKLVETLRTELVRADTIAVAESVDDSQREVRAALETLPTAQSELLKLIHWDGLTIADAAAVLGLNASTVRSRYSVAKATIEAELSAHVRMS